MRKEDLPKSLGEIGLILAKFKADSRALPPPKKLKKWRLRKNAERR